MLLCGPKVRLRVKIKTTDTTAAVIIIIIIIRIVVGGATADLLTALAAV